GLDNESLAEAMGKHYNSIIRLKQEQSTTLANLEKLCQALQCHPFDLIVAEGFPEPFLVPQARDRKSTRLNSSHVKISYAVFCLNDPPATDSYALSLHDALPIWS